MILRQEEFRWFNDAPNVPFLRRDVWKMYLERNEFGLAKTFAAVRRNSSVLFKYFYIKIYYAVESYDI